MKKSLRFFLSMLLALVGMTANAQTQVTSVDDLSEDKVYQIKAPRDYLGITEGGTMNRVNWGGANYATPGDDNKFAIMKGTQGYYLFSTTRGLFVPTEGNATDGNPVKAVKKPVGAFEIEAATKYADHFKFVNPYGQWMMLGGSYQFLASDSWSQEDDGDVWGIYETEETLGADAKTIAKLMVDAYEQGFEVYTLEDLKQVTPADEGTEVCVLLDKAAVTFFDASQGMGYIE